jgi:hypothetical protein
MSVERRGGNAGGAGDVGHRDMWVSALHEQLGGTFDELPATIGRSARTGGLDGHGEQTIAHDCPKMNQLTTGYSQKSYWALVFNS